MVVVAVGGIAGSLPLAWLLIRLVPGAAQTFRSSFPSDVGRRASANLIGRASGDNDDWTGCAFFANVSSGDITLPWLAIAGFADVLAVMVAAVFIAHRRERRKIVQEHEVPEQHVRS